MHTHYHDPDKKKAHVVLFYRDFKDYACDSDDGDDYNGYNGGYNGGGSSLRCQVGARAGAFWWSGRPWEGGTHHSIPKKARSRTVPKLQTTSRS